jgi:uncharacterized protein
MNIIPIKEEYATHAGTTELPQKIVIEGNPVFDTWISAEFAAEGKVKTGLWVGGPGKIDIRGYPADEFFTIVSGKVEVTNDDGSAVIFNPGESGLIRKGWKGVWHNIEKASKSFVNITK